MPAPGRVKERIVNCLKNMTIVLAQQRARDVSEADTVTLVKDILSDAFGYDKYAELTSEHCIRGTYCDLAIKVADKLVQLVEVKAIGTDLDDRHVKQAIDYASNVGIEWVVLTNGAVWRMYQVVFAKPIDKRLLAEVDLLKISLRNENDLERMYLFTKEGFIKGAHIELRDRQDATSRFVLSALLLHNDAVVSTIRRELRRVVEVKVEDDAIAQVLREEVIKRDNLEGPEAEAAVRKVNRSESKPMRTAKPESQPTAVPAEAPAASPAGPTE